MKFQIGQTFEPTFFFCSVIAEAQHSVMMLDLFAYSSYDEVFWFVSLLHTLHVPLLL